MARDLEKEMDEVRGTLAELMPVIQWLKDALPKAAPGAGGLPAFTDRPPRPEGDRIFPMAHMHPNEHIRALISDNTAMANAHGLSGIISYLGVYASGGRQSNWVKHMISADDLCALIENGSAQKVLAGIGNGARLNLLLALLKKPMTVAQMMEACGFGSTGQVYHHLKILQSADIVEEDAKARGVYAVIPHRVQGIIMLLAGVSDMVDATYTQGQWEAPEGQGASH